MEQTPAVQVSWPYKRSNASALSVHHTFVRRIMHYVLQTVFLAAFANYDTPPDKNFLQRIMEKTAEMHAFAINASIAPCNISFVKDPVFVRFP